MGNPGRHHLNKFSKLLKVLGNFPGGPVVKNPPSNAGNAGSIPGQGTKIPQATEQLSPCTRTTEFACLNQRACVPQTTDPTHSGTRVPQLQSPRTLEPACHNQRRENPHATTREKPACCNERSHIPQCRSHMLQLRPDAAKIK